jgi:hypothetical protein
MKIVLWVSQNCADKDSVLTEKHAVQIGKGLPRYQGQLNRYCCLSIPVTDKIFLPDTSAILRHKKSSKQNPSTETVL